MSTTADVLPYMQHWLDSRPAQTQAKTDFNNANAALTTSRAAIANRIAAGDNANQLTTQVTNYVNAKTAYVAADAALRNAEATTAGRRERFEQMIELLVSGQEVPLFTP